MKFKVFKFTIAILSTILLLISPVADFLKTETLRRYDLRWYQEDDDATLTQTIVVRNAGVEPKDNLVLDLNFDSNASRVLADFDVASDENGPVEKFFDTVARTGSGESVTSLTADETTRVSQLLDRHFNDRKLNYLDGVFDDILKSRMEAANGLNALKYLATNNHTTENWHAQWSNRCSENRSDDCGPVDTVLAGWEKARNAFRNSVLQNWKERTGVSIASNSDHLSTDKKLSMLLSLAPGEQRIFKFHYAQNPGNIIAAFRSMKGEQTHLLADRQSVYASFVGLLLNLYPFLYLLVFVLLVLLLVFGDLLIPLQIIPIYRVFNFALKSEDEDYWKHAFERHRYFIFRQFRMFQDTEAARAELTEQQVLDHIRDWLVDREKHGSPPFKSTKSLNRSIEDCLWSLALKT